MEAIDLIEILTKTNGVSGDESAVSEAIAELCVPFSELPIEIDDFHNVICTIRPPREGEPHLLLEAHLDEIGFMVTSISDEGLLHVVPCGGIDRRLQAATSVLVWGRPKTPIPGVVGYLPPELDGPNRTIPKADEMVIDIGFSKEKAKTLVTCGDRATPDITPLQLRNSRETGKALDNRSGCAAVLLAGEMLAACRDRLKCGVTLLFGSMEEVGSSGTRTAAYKIAPTHAIVVDVSFSATHDMSMQKYPGKIGGGPMIGYSPVLSKDLSRYLETLARKNGIPCQTEVMGGRTGTDADAIAVTRGGVKTGLLSIPQRYMHTPVEIIDTQDIRQTALLMLFYGYDLGGGAI